MPQEYLSYLIGVIGIVSFIVSQRKDSKSDGAQLARIEANGITLNTTLTKVEGRLTNIEKEQSVSKTFRDKYEEPLKEVIKFKEEQERLNTHSERDFKEIKKDIQKLNEKFDRMMEMFNQIIAKEK